MMLHSKGVKKLLVTIRENEPIKFGRLKQLMGYSSNHLMHFMKKAKRCNAIKKEGERYILTRIGMQILSLLNEFEQMCFTYDLDDCDADGKIIEVVQRSYK